jgi:hypothetical protein
MKLILNVHNYKHGGGAKIYVRLVSLKCTTVGTCACGIYILNKKFWEEVIAYFPDTTRATLQVMRPTILLLFRVYSLPR